MLLVIALTCMLAGVPWLAEVRNGSCCYARFVLAPREPCHDSFRQILHTGTRRGRRNEQRWKLYWNSVVWQTEYFLQLSYSFSTQLWSAPFGTRILHPTNLVFPTDPQSDRCSAMLTSHDDPNFSIYFGRAASHCENECRIPGSCK